MRGGFFTFWAILAHSAACRRRQLSALQTMEMPLDGDKYDSLLIFTVTAVHSGAKCLVWVKKCCHVWLDQNFYPSLLNNKLLLVFKFSSFQIFDQAKRDNTF